MTVAGILIAALLIADSAAAQPQSAAIRGRVTAADGQPVAAATVTLLDQLGSRISGTTSDADGRFLLGDVRPGTYTVFAEAPPQRSDARTVTLRAALALDVDLTLSTRIAESVVVRGTGESLTVASGLTISGETLRQLPARLSSRSLQQLLTTLPGFAAEDNGLLHVRGADDGFLYVVDGVPVYDRVDALFGIAPNAADIGSVNVLTGYIPAEFGMKSGAVIEVQSPPVSASGLAGDADAAIGSDRLRSLRAGGHAPLGGGTSVDAGATAETSERHLDPVHPENLHNEGDTISGHARVNSLIKGSSLLRLNAAAGRSRYQVPHGDEQEEHGQDQWQRLQQQSLSGSWQRSWSDTLVSHAAGYARVVDATLRGSANDSPLSARSDRRHERMGVAGGLTYARGRHIAKVGFEAARLELEEDFAFAVTDADEAEEAGISDSAAQFTEANPFRFQDRVERAQWSFYAQDSFRVTDRLTIDYGLRWDRTRLLLPASQWSPRAGAALGWPGTSTTWRGSVNRFFQPPQPEHLLLSSSPDARALSPFAGEANAEGGADLLPERQTAWEAGVEQRLGGAVRLDAAYWSRHVRNYADPNVFFGTTVVFPNSVSSGTARGMDARLELARYRGWSAYATYTLSKVEQIGPINGGLFLEDEVIEIGPGTRFTPDHDQRHAGGAGVTYHHAGRGFTASAAFRYESGTPLEVEEDDLDELMERPGAELVNFEAGRVRARSVFDIAVAQTLHRAGRMETSLRVSILNATNQAYALNFGNPFSGTHFGAPRTLRVDFRISVN